MDGMQMIIKASNIQSTYVTPYADSHTNIEWQKNKVLDTLWDIDIMEWKKDE